MSFFLRFFAVLCFFAVSSAEVLAATIDTPGKQVILVDATSGTTLFEKNADERMPTSSMSKVMTLYMVFDALKNGRLGLSDELLVSEKAWRMQGSKMFIEVGKKIKVEDLVRGVVVQSGNDATVALAEGLGGSEDVFSAEMNVRAKELGLTSSNFINSTGWPDPNHYSTARDLALLAGRLISDHPGYYHYFAEKEFVFNKIRQPNRNPLLSKGVVGADGIKTGHTEAAGYGLIGSAERNGRRLVLVVNGLSSEKERETESARLLEWGFTAFENVSLYKAGDKVEEASVHMGTAPRVFLTVEENISMTMARVDRSGLQVKAVYETPVEAPVKKGQELGKLVVAPPGAMAREYKIVAGNDVPRLGLFGRMKYKFMHLIGREGDEG